MLKKTLVSVCGAGLKNLTLMLVSNNVCMLEFFFEAFFDGY